MFKKTKKAQQEVEVDEAECVKRTDWKAWEVHKECG